MTHTGDGLIWNWDKCFVLKGLRSDRVSIRILCR
jgi:hypothetical protein